VRGWLVRLSCVVYAVVLHVLPRALRREHGEAMAVLYERLAADGWRRGGAPGLAAVFVRSLVDVAGQAVWTRLGRWRAADPAPALAHADGSIFPDRGRRYAMDAWWLDVRQSVRSLARRPLLALLAVVTFALGIGANTAIFSVVSGVLLRALPYEEPERVVRLVGTRGGTPNVGGVLAYMNARDVAARSRTLAGVAAYDEWRPNVTVGGEAELADAAQVDAGFFEVLGVRPFAGRFFLSDEDEDGNDRVVVLSHGYWLRRFGGDGSIVGRTVVLNGTAHTVVGVTPSDFEDPRLSSTSWGAPAFWRPLGFGGVPDSLRPSRGSSSYVAVARLRPDATVAAARAELAALSRQLEGEYPEENEAVGMTAVPLRDSIVGHARGSLLLLLGAVGLVLAIAAANVGNLLLGRATERRHEVALRAALGASRGRIVRLIVTETVVLALAGGALGIVLAAGATSALVRLGEEFVPRGANVSLDPLVLAFAFGVTLLTGLVCGVMPALLATSGDLRGALGESMRRASPTRGAARVRQTLVAAEVALALVLLTGAGLLGKSLWRLMRVDVGIATEGVLTFNVVPTAAQYPDAASLDALVRELDAALAVLPGVRSVAVTNVLPLSGGFDGNRVRVPGRPEPPAAERLNVQLRTVTPSFFETAGLTLHDGRLFDGRDRAGSVPVAVVGEALAATFWPGERPIGRQLIVLDTIVEVIGVVADVKHLRIEDPAAPMLYLARAQALVPWHPRQMTFLLRTDGEPGARAAAVRSAVRALDPLLPVAHLQTMAEVVARSAAPARFRTLLLGGFAALALVLASVGIYGVVSYGVAQRRRELAIRMAVGARAREVRAMVLRQGLAPVALGAAIGLLGALAGARVLASVLFQVPTTDVFVFISVPAVLCMVAVLATVLPARRATRVDPITVLREE
jgi:putative ABC transport system permease protein